MEGEQVDHERWRERDLRWRDEVEEIRGAISGTRGDVRKVQKVRKLNKICIMEMRNWG